ncbi:DUF4190 domain-containing protein [Streptomyces millisiae]|uniref:DUF4190 domain-containing protein n=1 Tax=Streptomyces millisiae TaxID=3075542 RepID=A0ABU2M079_9ACTN|nr:DUF4190 domain-containing protein [Streptomyces sp. DSM 44918]MDT0323210.1 DUF4190 domain-containing protein [Streptomyces sp. DSM 44918]
MAVVALVCAIVFFPVGLILGIVALARVVESRERGRGLAVAAIVVAGLQIVGLASLFSYVALNDDRRSDRAGVEAARSGPSAEDPGRETSVFDLAVGDCFSAGAGLDSVTDVTVLSCAAPHESEMFAAFDVDQYGDFGLTYPGEEALFDVAEVGCAEALPGYVLDVWAIPLEVSWFYYYPEEVGWRYGDREVLCYLGDVNGGELTGGSLRGDEAALTPRALAYLEVTAAVEALITREPLEDASVDEQRAWAGQMADALAREADALEAGSWYGEASRLVDDLVAARRESLDHWRAAAEATAGADLDALVELGYSTLGVEIEVEIRRLLDLDLGGW